MNDKTIKVRIPQASYDLAQVRIGRGNMSSFVRTAINNYIKGGDTPEQIQQQINEKEKELLVLRQKLQQLQKEEQITTNWKQEQEANFQKACQAITRMENHLGYIGKNQIQTYSQIWNVDKSELYKYCEEKGYTLTNYGEARR